MKLLASIAGGLAGAATVAVLNAVVRRVDPTMPKVGIAAKLAGNKLINNTLLRSKKAKIMTAAVYIVGGLVANAVTHRMEKRKAKQSVSPYTPPEHAYKPILDIVV